mmetsp:Transcript_18240/g.61973  ORF Transcript_18240/g.61973 Transcript_18240/m.61973 type:complete len:282 (+) Transcript_18240:491-1336(+)
MYSNDSLSSTSLLSGSVLKMLTLCKKGRLTSLPDFRSLTILCWLYIDANSPPSSANSSSRQPLSTMHILAKAYTLSLASISERSCVIAIIVLSVAHRRCKDSAMLFLLKASNADVASSKNRTCGSRTNALAMATRCLWPPESRLPPRPTGLLVPQSPCTPACVAAFIICAWFALIFPSMIFSSTVLLNRNGSCDTTAITLSCQTGWICANGSPFIFKVPPIGSIRPVIPLRSVLLPHPLRPTRYTLSPFDMRACTSVNECSNRPYPRLNEKASKDSKRRVL